MAIAVSAPDAGIQRGRGGFMRNAQDTPYVTDPTGAVVKTGERKGQPKRIPYGSPSSRGKQIESTYNLQKWSERRVVMGIGVDLALIAECAAVARLDPESDEYKDAADRVVLRAKDAAQASLAAERGTFVHSVLEAVEEGRDWISLCEAGELVGIPIPVQHRIAAGWRHMLAVNGLDVLVTEASCVDDTWRLAGTLDNIVRCTKTLRFALVTGEIRTISAGTVIVLDKKTSKKRLGRDGAVQWWNSYGIQIASYAQSVPYDTETETRGEWPWPIDQQHALIGHIDVDAALAECAVEDICSLIYVDLEASRTHGGGTVVAAKEWEARRDLFSVSALSGADVAQLPDDEIAVPADVPPAAVEQQAAEAAPSAAENVTADAEVREASAGMDAGAPSAVTPTDVPAVAPSAAGTSTLTPAEQRARVDSRGVPDEGGDADPAAVAALEQRYQALDAEANAVIKQLAIEAHHGHVPFHLSASRTRRRFEILRGLVAIASHVDPQYELVRCVLAPITGDLAHFANVTPGHLLGTLSADEAALFARLCDEYVTEAIPTELDEASGHVVLRFPSLAAHAA